MLSVKEIVELAESLGWTFKSGTHEVVLLFKRLAQDGTRQRVDVYYTTRTVATALKHPKQGRTQLYRRNVTDEELKEILTNPRTHTGKGYHNEGTKATQRAKRFRTERKIQQHERKIRRRSIRRRGITW